MLSKRIKKLIAEIGMKNENGIYQLPHDKAEYWCKTCNLKVLLAPTIDTRLYASKNSKEPMLVVHFVKQV